MKGILKYLLLIAIILTGNTAYSQPVNKLVSAIDSFAVRMPIEKVFLHIDKPYYSNTDTIWLKAYILNGQLESSPQSGLFYTELVNDTGRVVLRQAMPVLLGVSWGQMALDSVQVPEGSYTLRAYTNWMQNIGSTSFFTRQLYISKGDDGTWLVNADYKTTTKDGRANMEVMLQLLRQDSDPVRLQDLRLKLTDGSKTHLREKIATDIDGKLRFNFDVPPKAGRLTLVAEEKSGSKRIVVPLSPDQDENADVQFMPEGGSLVAGLMSKTGFKAVGQDGKGINIRGVVFDSKNNEVTSFQSLHKGMGFFLFTPVIGESYTAKVTLPKGLVKTYPLPVIKSSGMVLMVNNIPGRDSIILAVQVTGDIANSGGSYSLIAQSGGKVYYASTVSFKDGSPLINGRVAKSKFPTGVARFTLLSDMGQPIVERIIFIDHHDRLNISINTDKKNYQPKDSVSLGITVTDKNNKPVQGSFSLAITDDSQIKADSTNVPDINSYMLLQSELRGNIEDPGYYFDHQTPHTELNLDNLLLTQGWLAYEWKQVFDRSASLQYRAEKEIGVSGSVKRLSKIQAGLKVTLLSVEKGLLFRDTLTDTDGRFNFTNLPQADTPAYMLQVGDKRGKIFEANILMDEFMPADTKHLAVPNLTPWYVNSDSTLLNYNRQSIRLHKEMQKIKYPAGVNVLKEVVIKARKKIKGSRFFSGFGAVPDMVLDEKDMINAKKMSVEDLLKKHVSGFGQRLYLKKTFEYMVNDLPVYLIIDGFSVERFYYPSDIPGPNEHLNYIRAFLTQLTAEDVKGIELKTTSRMVILTDKEKTEDLRRVTYIEITTWSGNGAFMKRVRGRALYRPLPVSWPKEFYKPKYTAKPDPLFDLRSTVHWQPDIITDEEGKASVVFYTKSKKAAYTVVIQGADMNGSTGYGKVAIAVKSEQKSDSK